MSKVPDRDRDIGASLASSKPAGSLAKRMVSVAPP